MQRLSRIIGGLVAGFVGMPSLAFAACGGSDQFLELARENPAAHSEILRRAEEVVNGKGIFWRVENGTAPASYLFGTYHDTEVAMRPLDPEVEAVLTGARVMLVEVTEEEQARLQWRMATDPSFSLSGEGPLLSHKLDDAARAAADAALARRGLSLALVDQFRPALAMSILAQPQCALEAMAAGKPVLDSVLMARAAKAGVPVKGLETYEAALASIDRIDRDVVANLMIEAVANLDQLEDFRRTALGFYDAGDMGLMREFELWQAERDLGPEESRRMLDALTESVVDGRNHDWMPVMVPELEQGGVFVAFGAMHLIGEEGVVELLREQGFTVTRADG